MVRGDAIAPSTFYSSRAELVWGAALCRRKDRPRLPRAMMRASQIELEMTMYFLLRCVGVLMSETSKSIHICPPNIIISSIIATSHPLVKNRQHARNIGIRLGDPCRPHLQRRSEADSSAVDRSTRSTLSPATPAVARRPSTNFRRATSFSARLTTFSPSHPPPSPKRRVHSAMPSTTGRRRRFHRRHCTRSR